VADQNQDDEINEFKNQLRQILSGALDEGELYTEAKFFQVDYTGQARFVFSAIALA
jgi:hypothetical protein